LSEPRQLDVALATGLRYRVLEWLPEQPRGRTIALVHGFADLAYGWCEVAPRLAARGHRVIAPDLRGHGDSERVGAGGYYHFLDYVADLDDVIAQCAGNEVVLVGHSMGGTVCGYYAGVRPERLAALVLIEGLGPPDMSGSDGPTRTAAWIDAWRTAARDGGKVLASIDEAVARLRRHDALLDEALARRIAAVGTRPSGGGLTWKLDPLHATMGPYPFRLETARRYWQRVTCPVLCVDGGESQLNLSSDERASRRTSFANVRHLEIAGAGHAVQRHRPAELADAILSMC
jgi:pimeloyl-ACP methyl ester carboxylesterase